MYDLSVVLIAQGRYKTAEEVIRKLVESHESQSGDDDMDMLKALCLLSQVLASQGLYVKAKRLNQRVLKGRVKGLRVETPRHAH